MRSMRFALPLLFLSICAFTVPAQQARLLVAQKGDRSLAIVDPAAGTVISSVPEGGITGHPDHQRATESALACAEYSDLPVLAWALDEAVASSLNGGLATGFVGRSREQLDFDVRVDRARQSRAIACHASQSTNNPVLWQRLCLQGDRETFRWLRRPKY